MVLLEKFKIPVQTRYDQILKTGSGSDHILKRDPIFFYKPDQDPTKTPGLGWIRNPASMDAAVHILKYTITFLTYHICLFLHAKKFISVYNEKIIIQAECEQIATPHLL